MQVKKKKERNQNNTQSKKHLTGFKEEASAAFQPGSKVPGKVLSLVGLETVGDSHSGVLRPDMKVRVHLVTKLPR